jgi:hypothetical protein
MKNEKYFKKKFGNNKNKNSLIFCWISRKDIIFIGIQIILNIL